ncbi:hypothetical protein [Demequina sp. NBRC 110056]|uniref:hypothetical protein n=1 Tax=Demequina sp. NBRC 110056 TaxID=1570345 RepID=UPI000A03F616|nr:hypothetical protein [Demequina sp. NBRC 110056]
MTELDHALDASAPATSHRTAERDSALKELISSTRPRRRAGLRGAAIATGAAALLGLGGVTAAASLGWTSWWAEDAVNDITYTLPSGAECEGILGNFRGNADEVSAAEDFMAQPRLLERLDVEAEYDRALAATYVATLDDGAEVDAGPGTPYWSADRHYAMAVGHATSDALYEHLRELGVLDRLSYETEYRCPELVPADLEAREIRSDW